MEIFLLYMGKHQDVNLSEILPQTNSNTVSQIRNAYRTWKKYLCTNTISVTLSFQNNSESIKLINYTQQNTQFCNTQINVGHITATICFTIKNERMLKKRMSLIRKWLPSLHNTLTNEIYGKNTKQCLCSLLVLLCTHLFCKLYKHNFKTFPQQFLKCLLHKLILKHDSIIQTMLGICIWHAWHT